MKRKNERLTVSQIVKSFKKRFTVLKGNRSYNMHLKIANIYFADGAHSISTKLVSELELTSILHSRVKMQGILAIQLYLGLWPLKGCGVFEHHYWHNDKQEIIQNTYELVYTPDEAYCFDIAAIQNITPKFNSPLTSKLENVGASNTNNRDGVTSTTHRREDRLNIVETQHDLLKPIAARVVKYMEKSISSTVTSAVFEFVFNMSWAPFLVGVKNICLANVPDEVLYNRESIFFPQLYARDRGTMSHHFAHDRIISTEHSLVPGRSSTSLENNRTSSSTTVNRSSSPPDTSPLPNNRQNEEKPIPKRQLSEPSVGAREDLEEIDCLIQDTLKRDKEEEEAMALRRGEGVFQKAPGKLP